MGVVGLSSPSDSEGSGRLHPFARTILEEVYLLSGEKPGGGKVGVEFLHQLLGGQWSEFREALDLLKEKGLIDWRTPAQYRRDITLTAKGDAFLREHFVEEGDEALYRALKVYIDPATPNPLYRLKLARLLRLILKEHGGAEINLHGVEERLTDLLRSRRRDESNERFLHLAWRVASSEPSPVMMRCLGSVVDRLFDVAYAATYFKNRGLRLFYIFLHRLFSPRPRPLSTSILLGLVLTTYALIAILLWPTALLLFLLATMSIPLLALIHVALTQLALRDKS